MNFTARRSPSLAVLHLSTYLPTHCSSPSSRVISGDLGSSRVVSGHLGSSHWGVFDRATKLLREIPHGWILGAVGPLRPTEGVGGAHSSYFDLGYYLPHREGGRAAVGARWHRRQVFKAHKAQGVKDTTDIFACKNATFSSRAGLRPAPRRAAPPPRTLADRGEGSAPQAGEGAGPRGG